MTADTVIVGLGQTGLSCLRFLTHYQPERSVAVVDTRQAPPQLADCQTQYPNVPIYLGELPEALLFSATQIVVSPGLPLHGDIWDKCRARDIAIIGDIELFAQYAKAPIIGITGSNGKGTVTTLVTNMALAAGQNAIACGNIGYSALDALLDAPTPDWYVAELSSFQLLSTYSLHTYAAVILNLTPDHLDYHQTMQHYLRAKQRIYQHCIHPIINRDAPICHQDYPFEVKPISYGLQPPPTAADYGIVSKHGKTWLAKGEVARFPADVLRIVGQHNWQNALAAMAITDCMQLPNEAIKQGLTTFTGLAHRCQWVAQHHGVTWYNDSKGTNVAATEAAITGVATTLTTGKIILLMGGQAKGADFKQLIPTAKQYVRTIYVFGEDANAIETALSSATTVIGVTDLADAVAQAKYTAQAGDSVLLSPACASFDMFANFVKRGEQFIQLVKDVTQ